MNGSGMSGLAAGLEYFVKSRDADSDREKDYALTQRKLELANKLEMDLLKQKQEYANANPKYAHFLKTAEGNIVGMDERGNTRTVYEETPEGKDLLKEKLEGDTAYKNAAAAAAIATAEGKGLLAPVQADYYKARTIAAGKPKVSSRKPTNEIDEGGFQKLVDAEFARTMGKDDATTVTGQDAQLAQTVLNDPTATPARKKGAQSVLQEYQQRQAARKSIEQSLRPKYKVVTGQGLLVAPAAAEEDTEEEDPFASDIPTDE